MKSAVLLLTAGVLLFSCASSHESDFDNRRPVIRNLAAYNERLYASAESNECIQLQSIGVIEYPGFRADLYVAEYTPAPEPERTIVITGGVHGNEPAGAEFPLTLIEALANRAVGYKDTRIVIIPMINPWGWVHDNRFNYYGKDINRDFASFHTQEARAVREYLDGKPFDLAIDHHEDPGAAGVYLYQYGKKDSGSAREVLTEIESIGFPLEQDVSMVILKTKDGLINAPMWGLLYMRLTKQLSITNYLRLENSKHVYTVETPVTLPMEKRVEIHMLVFRRLSK